MFSSRLASRHFLRLAPLLAALGPLSGCALYHGLGGDLPDAPECPAVVIDPLHSGKRLYQPGQPADSEHLLYDIELSRAVRRCTEPDPLLEAEITFNVIVGRGTSNMEATRLPITYVVTTVDAAGVPLYRKTYRAVLALTGSLVQSRQVYVDYKYPVTPDTDVGTQRLVIGLVE